MVRQVRLLRRAVYDPLLGHNGRAEFTRSLPCNASLQDLRTASRGDHPDRLLLKTCLVLFRDPQDFFVERGLRIRGNEKELRPLAAYVFCNVVLPLAVGVEHREPLRKLLSDNRGDEFRPFIVGDRLSAGDIAAKEQLSDNDRILKLAAAGLSGLMGSRQKLHSE